jgi:clan AA aspartic protease (TIGR02281 family)
MGQVFVFIWILLVSDTVRAQWTVPLRRAGSHLLVDGVRVNGQGPFRFLLDTGAQSTTLHQAIAERLGLRPSYRVEVVSVNGSTLAPATRVTSVTLGSASALDMEVMWCRLAGFDGILGQNFLHHFRYGIDLRRRQLHFEEDSEPAGVRLPLETSDGRPLIRLGGLRLVIDSGSPALILFRKIPRLPAASTVTMSTTTGSSRAAPAILPSLEIGEIRLKNVPVIAQPDPDRAEDGLLPVTPFESVWVNPREGYVILEPRRTIARRQNATGADRPRLPEPHSPSS